MRHRYGTNNEVQSETLTLYPVTGGSDENKSFSNSTPSGKIEIQITNPELFGKFKTGESYYVDFTKAEK